MDPDYLRTCKRLSIALTPEQRWAFAWLTYRGQRFLIDFGYENAVRLAEVDMNYQPYRVH